MFALGLLPRGESPRVSLTLSLALAACVTLGLVACQSSGSKPNAAAGSTTSRKGGPESGRSDEKNPTTSDGAAESEPTSGGDVRKTGEDAHQVVYADRISQGYLLLLANDRGTDVTMTRDTLLELVRGSTLDDATKAQLATLIETEPQTAPLALPSEETLAQAAAGLPTDEQVAELLGLHIEVLKRDDATIPSAALQDEILSRDLDPLERDAALRSEQVLLLRADYRNQHGLLGLRLLQQLVVLVATQRGALIHDPDTRETVSADYFGSHVIPEDLGGVSSQIAIIPFQDTRNGKGFVKLATRGMRKLGCVDLELDGLPQDIVVLERATWLLSGLASTLLREAASHGSGVGYEVDDSIEITRSEIVRAYGGQAPWRTECAGCSGSTDVHLVERTPEPADPVHHRVARVVAPRELSDLDEYVQPIWALAALEDVFGAVPEAPSP